MPNDGWKLVVAAMRRRQQAELGVPDEAPAPTEEELTAKRLADLRAKYVTITDKA